MPPAIFCAAMLRWQKKVAFFAFFVLLTLRH